MTPPKLAAVLERYGLDGPELEMEHHKSWGEWRVRSGERMLRWVGDVEARGSGYILKDATMLAVLERHQLVAPRLLVLEQSDDQVLSIQHLLMPGALQTVEEVGLEVEGWRSLGAYVRAFHERLRLPDFNRETPAQGWELDLQELEQRGEVTRQDARWLRHWHALLPRDTARVVTHGHVAPGWIVADPSRQLILALTDWGAAAHREPGHDLLWVPPEVVEHVLSGYGPDGLPRLLRAKLSQLVKAARGAETTPLLSLADEFERFVRLLEPRR